MSLAFRHAIVVGASSGIGAEIARQLAADACAVALLGRRSEELERVRMEIAARGKGRAITAVHDATRYDTVPALLDRLVQDLGGLDLLVYAAGTMRKPAESEYDFARDRAEIEVNLLGAIAWTTPVAAMFEAHVPRVFHVEGWSHDVARGPAQSRRALRRERGHGEARFRGHAHDREPRAEAHGHPGAEGRLAHPRRRAARREPERVHPVELVAGGDGAPSHAVADLPPPRHLRWTLHP
jgi:hypothetical protein